MPANNLALNRDRLALRYKVGGNWTPNYGLMASSQTSSSPYNTAQTPFLVPEAADEFGGLQYVGSGSAAPVWWALTVQFILNGSPITSSTGIMIGEIAVTPPLGPGETDGCGYRAFMQGHAGAFQPSDLPVRTPVTLRLGLRSYSDDKHQHLLVDDDPSNNELDVWVMRTPS
jgi:hypothetical protein